MQDLPYEQHPEWRAILEILVSIREQEDYSPANVEFIRLQLQSLDDRVRGGAALTASGCIFEPGILELVIDLAEEDDNLAIRKAAIQSLGAVISEGVAQDFEDEIGSDTWMDEVEEWSDYQTGSLRDDYLRVKYLLFNFLEYQDDITVQEAALAALVDLGFLMEIREKTVELLASERQSSQLVALHAIGKYPGYWEDELAELISPDTPNALLKEAISASYSSNSARLAKKIEGVLGHADSEVLRFALLTLANLNKTEGLADILQHFSLHEDPLVQEAAKEGIELTSRKNFEDYMKDNLGMEE